MNPEEIVPFYFGIIIVSGVLEMGLKDLIKKYPERSIFIGLAAYLMVGIGLAYFKGIDKAGQVGDFFNPIIALVSAALIYRTIRVQMDANKIQTDGLKEEQKEREYDNFLRQINRSMDNIRSDFGGLFLQYNDVNHNQQTAFGMGSLEIFTTQWRTNQMGTFEPYVISLTILMGEIVHVRKKILEKCKDVDLKDYHRMSTTYRQPLLNTLKSLVDGDIETIRKGRFGDARLELRGLDDEYRLQEVRFMERFLNPLPEKS